ncbi:hypothetical protein [Lactobacillus hominis]|uniref:hypothetical protein n=1 Tax=Lactobacillus hominis TaxID=1203033 RepID=UPI00263830EA|nr:hypothetical protein [Lactobacillus hominis]
MSFDSSMSFKPNPKIKQSILEKEEKNTKVKPKKTTVQLSIDADKKRKAKIYAALHNKTLSQLFEEAIDALPNDKDL